MFVDAMEGNGPDPSPPRHHCLFWLWRFQFYWFWINEGSELQHRCYVAGWYSQNLIIHLSHHDWKVPLLAMPKALWSSYRLIRAGVGQKVARAPKRN